MGKILITCGDSDRFYSTNINSVNINRRAVGGIGNLLIARKCDTNKARRCETHTSQSVLRVIV